MAKPVGAWTIGVRGAPDRASATPERLAAAGQTVASISHGVKNILDGLRGGAYIYKRGLRIDLILGSKALAEACTSCRIDKEPRKLERPSDHTPVVAEFDL